MRNTFLKCMGIWALFTAVPVFSVALRSGTIYSDEFLILFLLLLLPLLGTILLFVWVDEMKSLLLSVLTGLTLGLALPALGGVLLFLVTEGFESPAILAGAAILCVPSSVGGTLAGWIYGRAITTEQQFLKEPHKRN